MYDILLHNCPIHFCTRFKHHVNHKTPNERAWTVLYKTMGSINFSSGLENTGFSGSQDHYCVTSYIYSMSSG